MKVVLSEKVVHQTINDASNEESAHNFDGVRSQRHMTLVVGDSISICSDLRNYSGKANASPNVELFPYLAFHSIGHETCEAKAALDFI